MNILLQKLIDRAKELDVYDISSEILEDSRFPLWSAASKSHFHHYGKGGLLQHTYEVVELCFSNYKLLNLDIDPIELYLSALYHDCGKMWDYEPTNILYTEWQGTPHKRLIHHISKSALTWNLCCSKYRKYDKYIEPVLHNILSHHGQREWGSPVAPKTKAAWLLHLCDNISARMNDADKLDIVKQ